MRLLIEIILSFFKGIVAFFVYINFTRFLFVYTHKYTLLLYDFLKKVPCDHGPCKLRYLATLAAFVIRDTLFALPVLFVFGFLLGLIQKHYRLSRSVVLCLGFYFAQYGYNVVTATVSKYPMSVRIAHVLPVVLLFIFFSKAGYSVKEQIRFRKTSKRIENEVEKREAQKTKR